MEGDRISWDELTCVGYPVQKKLQRNFARILKSSGKKQECQSIL